MMGLHRAAAALVLLAQPVLAQERPGSLFDSLSVDADMPVEVSADALEVFEAENRARFHGNVRASQGALVIQADQIELRYTLDDPGGRTIEWLQADGSVHMRSGTDSAHGDAAAYDLVGQVVTIDGNVVLESDGSRLRGDRFHADLANGTSRMEGGATGRVQATFAVGSDAEQ